MTHPTKLPRGGVDPPTEILAPPAPGIANAAVPSHALIPLLQHSGTPAICLVKPGDHVREGMLIGKADGPRSAHVHSSIPGIVVDVRDHALPGRRVVHGRGHRARRGVRNIGKAPGPARVGEALPYRAPRAHPVRGRCRAGRRIGANPPEARRSARCLLVDPCRQRSRVGAVALRRRGDPVRKRPPTSSRVFESASPCSHRRAR